METIETTSLEFGGPLANLPPGWALAVLLLLLVVGAGAVAGSYRVTLRPLSAARKGTLGALRILLLFVILLCLANPTHIQRSFLPAPEPSPAALLVDHSTSMTTRDNRGQTRLDAAIRTWTDFATDVEKTVGEIGVFVFDNGPPARAENSIAHTNPEPSPPGTRFLHAVDELLTSPEKPSALFVLTDGLDTNTGTRDALLERIADAAVPCYFVVGENRLTPPEALTIRELNTPDEVLRRTAFPVHLVVESRSPEPQTLRLRIKADGAIVDEQDLRLGAGHSLIPIHQDLFSGETGSRELEVVIDDGSRTRSIRRQVPVVDSQNTRVLYYQGAPDWGYRTLNTIFARESGIELSSIFNPHREVTLISGAKKIRALPDTPEQLNDFHAIILSHLRPDQLTEAQQEALRQYVSSGGGLMLILPDADQAASLSGSILESMLPVYFEGPSEGADAARFQRRLHAHRSTPNSRSSKSELQGFEINQDVQFAHIFEQPGEASADPLIPYFASHAPAYRAKAGASVLARHPTKQDAAGTAAILLALQRYGAGYSVVLATDSLWRWKLDLPSESRAPEHFWRQLLEAVARERVSQIRFTNPPIEVAAGEPVQLEIAGAAPNESVNAFAIAPDGQHFPLAMDQGGHPRAHRALNWTPEAQTGEWQVVAQAGEARTRQWIQVRPKADPLPDRSEEAPDYALLERIAAASGGAVLTPASTLPWANKPVQTSAQLLNEERSPLWNIWPLFILATLAFAVELLLRRKWKLL